MFFSIFRFELKYWLKNASLYVYASVFFLLALLSMAGACGIFGEGSAGPGIANAPVRILTFALLFNKILLLLLPAIVGESIHRDYKSNIHSILYSYPFTKRDYLCAKFASSIAVVLGIALLLLLGLLLGPQMPGADPAKTTAPNLGVYLHIFLLYLAPNLFLTGVLVFAVVVVGRNIYAGFISVLLVLLVREMLSRLTGGAHAGVAGLLTDPFGETTTLFFTKNHTPAELDTLPIPLEPVFLVNRLIWLSVAAFGFWFVYRWFSFDQNAVTRRWKKTKTTPQGKPPSGGLAKTELPRMNPDFSFGQQVKSVWWLARTDFKYIANSGAFRSILAVGALFIAVVLLNMNPQTDTKLLPVTWAVLGIPVLFFSLLVQGLTFLYAGMLVHRAKAAKMNDLVDVTPAPNWTFFWSKWLALVQMQVVVLALVLVAGVAVQAYEGYPNFEIGHYLFDLYIIHLPGFVAWAFVALLVQTVFTNPYLGFFILILCAFGIENLPALGVHSPVFRFNQTPEPDFFLKYSDLNGYSHALPVHLLYRSYWIAFGLVLGGIALLFWPRGVALSFRERLRIAKTRLSGKMAFALPAVSAGVLCFGGLLFQAENSPANTQLTAAQEQQQLERFQREFGKYRESAQPRIISVFFNLNLFPESQSFQASGHYVLVNKTARPLDTLLLKSGYEEVTTVAFSRSADKIREDTMFKFSMYRLKTPLAPGDSMRMSFTIQSKPNTLFTRNSNVLANGTHLKNDIFPRLGYFADTAKKLPTDSTARRNHYQSIDADRIELEAIISTSSRQTALAPGYLLREWTEKDRRFFHYKTERDIKFVFSILSGEYALLQENYRGVDLRIYHHPQHTYCLPQMLAGLKAALDYNTAFFGAYQHRQAQIIEFPRSEGTYATTAANCIPISEIRFINDSRNPADGAVDIAFYVAAHELSHQWWGNQVVPADALGATMLTESIAEYITAKVYERQYGKKSALRFLEIQQNRYLGGRADETQGESSLILVRPDQSYIAYGKGALAFYQLSERIGEENLNAVLRVFLDKNKFQGPPYPTAPDLLDYLKRATPDSLQHLVRDWFEAIGPVEEK